MLRELYETQILQETSDPFKSYYEAKNALRNLSSTTRTFKRFLQKIITNKTVGINKDIETITDYLSKTQNLDSILKENPEILESDKNRDYYFVGKLFNISLYGKYASPSVFNDKTIFKRNIEKYGGLLLKAYISKLVKDKQ